MPTILPGHRAILGRRVGMSRRRGGAKTCTGERTGVMAGVVADAVAAAVADVVV
jgi:hypothetical protein